MSVFKKYLIDKSVDDELAGKPQSTIDDVQNGELVIAVMPNSWVFVGFLTKLDKEQIKLDCCYNIHEWGTTEGLGELAIKGPLADTKLNASCPIYGKPVFLIKVDADNW